MDEQDEGDNDQSTGISRDNPIVILDSPLKNLAPRKLRRAPLVNSTPSSSALSLTPKATLSPIPSQPTTLCPQSQQRVRGGNFELYSHATDPDRLLKSVYSVAGTPLLSPAYLAVDLTQSSDEEITDSPIVEPQQEQQRTSENEEQDIPMTVCEDPISLSVKEPRPFHKFSLGVLENLSDAGLSSLDRLEGYIQQTEQLLAQRYFIPSNKLPQVIHAIHGLLDEQFICRVHFLLCQDINLRPTDSSDLPLDVLHDSLCSIAHTLYHTPNHLTSRVLLHYICSLKPQFPRLHLSLILDTAFSALSVPSRGGLPSPTRTLLSLAAHSTNHSTLTTELSSRINQLPSSELKCKIFLYIDSQTLRLQVLNYHLSQYFHSDHNLSHGSHGNSHLLAQSTVESHFQRNPYRPSGEPHELGYFLSLLSLLVQTRLALSETLTTNLHHCVHSLTNRLSDDRMLMDELCSSEVWVKLQLLNSLA